MKASLLGKASLLAKSSRKKEFFTAETYGCVSFCVKEDKRESRHQNGGNPKETFFMTTLFVLVRRVFTRCCIAAARLLGCWRKLGSLVAIPVSADSARPLFRPGKAGTLAVAGLLLFVDYLLLAKSGYLAPLIAPALIQWGCIACAAVFLLRAMGDFRYVGFFKKVTHTAFARQDTRLFSPLCLWLGFAFVAVLL